MSRLKAGQHTQMKTVEQKFGWGEPDASICEDRENARCSLWWEQTPAWGSERVGLIGHYEAADRRSGERVLRDACERLAERDCTVAIGPMDGSTWHRYRMVIERGGELPFFLEPDNPDDWPEHFSLAGFEIISRYYSALNEDLSAEDPRAAVAWKRLERAGVRIRRLEASRLAEEMKRIHAVTVASFDNAFLFTPIDAEWFASEFVRLKPYLQAELVLIAEVDGRMVGYLFGLPDWLQSKRGEVIDTAIVKTLAILPGREWAGLGTVLTAEFHRAARSLGFKRCIHALMQESNRSRNISMRSARLMRTYGLFAKRL